MTLTEQRPQKTFAGLSLVSWVGFLLYSALVVCFYEFTHNASAGTMTSLEWLSMNWIEVQQGYEHGWMVPYISLYLLWHACRHMKGIPMQPNMHGLWLILVGALLALLSVRTNQPRVALAGAPFLLTGGVWYFWGRQVGLRCAFPFFFLWLAVPVPGFQQATVVLQLIAAEMAHWGAGLCGVATVVEGTSVASADGAWDTYSIAGGCSGMRSLMALAMISFAWGYLASGLALWKRITLALSALPLAVVANAFRVCSIFVCAEYITPSFAGKTWHDWSGLLFFFPASLVGLTLLHGLLAGEIPFFKKRRVVSRSNKTLSSPENAATQDTNAAEAGKEAAR